MSTGGSLSHMLPWTYGTSGCERRGRDGGVFAFEPTARIFRQEGRWSAPGVNDDMDTTCGRDRAAGPRLGERKPAIEPFGFQ